MADKNSGDVSVPQGKVGEVCKQWLVKEDGMLAYKLQNEEIEQHYEGNRWKSKIGRMDLHKAKNLQEIEEEILKEQQKMFQQQLVDEQIAKEIHDEYTTEERRVQLLKEEDERLAKKLHEKEKERQQKRRLQKERQQLEKIKVEKGLVSNMDSLNIEETHLNDIDLSDFCMKPPPGLSEEELKHFLAEQDAEIALFLQQQEAKRSDSLLKERRMLVEAQDFEIARLLQIEEKARIKRLKERARQKRMQSEPETCVDDDDIQATTEPESHPDHSQAATYYHNIAIDLDPTYKSNHTNSDCNSTTSGVYYAQVYQVSPGSTSSESPNSTLKTYSSVLPNYF
ncbi:Coiled-coil domain-containing protein 3-like protein [Leptotrombidium deliense]|uniref:Coiled-coil domain-containing protein 3-like protein n=1 Tax=Leptotrombidium deliense TaxID=299467 RepID=A0A443SLH1_9ACAR|nr:Coiled-coil domain-containing protein 3-like protein [Leptotrombidium deliense]